MNSALTPNQREYVLFHLNQVIDLSSDIRDKFVFDQKSVNKIYFLQTSNILDESKIIHIKGMPILFPGGNDEELYTFNKGTLVFHHDLLRSAFYLLSAYQEYQSKEKDSLGRFPYQASLQYKLGVLNKPIVNYYFQWICDGLKDYCDYHGIAFKKRDMFETFGFFLTHDVDRIDKYSFQSTKNRLKKMKIREFVEHTIKWLNPFDHDNPYWCFDFLLDLNKKYGMTSTYFFLNRGIPHIDSYYTFSMKKISGLIKSLEDANCEIALHGTVQSANDCSVMAKNLDDLNTVAKTPVVGNRQHRLTYSHPYTMGLMSENSIKYDTTLGYAGHEGFRNSYCLPFHLFDFEHDKMFEVWEFPLIVMDVTLFEYRNLSFQDALQLLDEIVGEIIHFHGIFTLLWHNSTCDESIKPGICQFYESILKRIHDVKGISVRGKDILEKLNV